MGAAFTAAADGDMRRGDRSVISAALGISSKWATVNQVHGGTVHEVDGPGTAGDGDALYTDRHGVPLAVFTADCGGVVLEGPLAVAVAHAGWRGAVSGCVRSAADRLLDGHDEIRAAIGPTIGPCCFEVGPEVAKEFPGYGATTNWGTPSVDLPGVIRSQVPEAEWWSADACTTCGDGYFSHRANGSAARMATLGWR